MRNRKSVAFAGILRGAEQQVAKIEKQMTRDLRRCARQFMKITEMAETTISRQAVGDPYYLTLVLRGERVVTPRKYDELVAYFDATLKKTKNASAKA